MIVMNDFKAEPQKLRDAMLCAVQRVMDSGWYLLGRELVGFEKLWAEQCGVAHAVGWGRVRRRRTCVAARSSRATEGQSRYDDKVVAIDKICR